MKSLIFYFSLFLVLLSGCKEESTNPNTDLYTISGKITNAYGSVANAKVAIDNKTNWEAKTSASGEFSISNVSSGNRTIYVRKKGQDEEFVEINYPIFVNTNLTLNNLILPIPVRLYPPANITQTEMMIIWNQTDAQDFREYKLYRRDTPGLDETTGELIFVSTAKKDTSFVDENLIPYETYYYRVYLMNEFGRMGGSNIASASTLGGNLIPDGEFEIVGSVNDNWHEYWGGQRIFDYDDSVKVEGNYALKGQNTYGDNTTMVLNNLITLIPGKTYQLSAWFKASGMASGGNDMIYVLLYSAGTLNPVTEIKVTDHRALNEPVEIEWTQRMDYFTVSEVSLVVTRFSSGFENYWIDDLKLIVAE